ncbi:MAG: KH domain-containing protein [Flavobacteriaceae bacterium]|nr:KH domain-containing protein [Flavobacteriaceae bacterium]
MGHKVSPIAFRIPYIKTWKSAWFSSKQSYKNDLGLDLKVRQILDKELTGIPLGDILISIEQDIIRVVVYTVKTALILGKTGENLERIQELLTRKTSRKVVVDIKEVKRPDLNAKIV